MALTGWGAANYLDLAAAIGDYPIKFSAWGKVASYAAIDEYTAVSLGIAGSSNNRRATLTQTGAVSGLGNRVRALVRTTTNSFATAASDSPAGSWYHLSGNFVSTILREALLNAANKGTNTTSRAPSAPSRTRIGVRPDLNDPWGATDGLAEVSVWNLTGFTGTASDDLDVKLAAGEVPTAINAEVGQPWTGKLLAYWPLLDNTDLADASGNGHTLTMVGTLTTFADHPPVGGGGLTDYTLTAETGSFALTGQDVGLNRGRTLTADVGTFALSGQDIAFISTVDGEPGLYTLSGQDVGLLVGYRLDCEAGLFALNGQDAGLLAARVLGADQGAFTLTGQDADLIYTPSTPGAYTLTADPGIFALTGQDAGVGLARRITADVGSFVLGGQDAGLLAARTLGAETGTFTLSGQDTALVRAVRFVAEPGLYVLTGQAATTTWSGEGLALPLPGPTGTRAVGGVPRSSEVGGIPRTREV